MKIIQVIPFYPPHLGGMEQRVKELSGHLAQRGYQVEVLTSNNNSRGIFTQDKVIVRYLPSITLAKTPIVPTLLLNILRSDRNTIVHAHIAQAFVPEAAYLGARLRKLPFIAHIRIDVQPSGILGFLLVPYKKFILGPILRHSDAVIVLNKDYKKLLMAKYGVISRKIHIIPNATTFPIQHLPTTTRLSKQRVKLLLVGRLAPEKNIELAIKAVAMLKNEDIDVELRVVGDGQSKSSLITLTKTLGIQKYIKFSGRLEDKRLQDAYSKCDIVIQTSFLEGFSTVLLEAMASAKPLIASDITGTRNVVRDGYNGLLVDPHSVDSLVNAIKKFISDESFRTSMIKNGLQEIKKYNWDEIVKRTEQVYEEVHV